MVNTHTITNKQDTETQIRTNPPSFSKKNNNTHTAYGSDIIIPLDELHPYHIDHDALVKCVLRSHRWEARSLREHLRDVKQQAMYAVVHGGVDP